MEKIVSSHSVNSEINKILSINDDYMLFGGKHILLVMQIKGFNIIPNYQCDYNSIRDMVKVNQKGDFMLATKVNVGSAEGDIKFIKIDKVTF